LQPQSETQTSSTSSANSASPIQTVNPFFQPPPAASASSDSTKTVTEVKAGTSESSIVAPTTDVVVAADPTTPSVEQPEQESVPPPVLDGFCPVTLHEALLSGDAAGAWVEGSPEFAVKHRSCIYWFKDEAQLQKFMDSPDKFAAVLSGYDLVSFLREGVLLPGKREHGYIRDGKLFLFSSEANKKQFAERHHEYVSELQQLLTHREAKKLNNPGTVTR
jgi:YHS domain-containing protein